MYRRPPWMGYEMDEFMDWVEALEGETVVRRLMDTYLGIIDALEGGQGIADEEHTFYYGWEERYQVHLKTEWEAANGPWED